MNGKQFFIALGFVVTLAVGYLLGSWHVMGEWFEASQLDPYQSLASIISARNPAPLPPPALAGRHFNKIRWDYVQ